MHTYTGSFPGIDTDRLNLMRISADPIIFFDAYSDTVTVKILFPNEMEYQHARIADFQDEELIEFALQMRNYPLSLSMARGFFAPGMLDGNREIIEAFKKRVSI